MTTEAPGKKTQVDLNGEPVPPRGSWDVKVSHRFESDHFKITIKNERLVALKDLTLEALSNTVHQMMKAKSTVRHLSPDTVREECGAIAQAILKAHPIEEV